jgi:hypothetical protein
MRPEPIPDPSRKIYACGICDHYHPADWDGDCRDDANRISDPNGWGEEVPMPGTEEEDHA